MDYIYLAKLNKTHGVRGEFKAYCLTDFPKERLKKGRSYFFFNEKTQESSSFTLHSWRDASPFLILKFDAIDTIEQAEQYLGLFLAIPKEDATLPDNHYFISDLIGCKAYSDEGAELGEVIDVFSYSPINNLRIRKEGRKDIQVPFLDEFVKEVDIASKKVVVHLIEGML
ncbi:MAG: ribosome maturation factor RimM [Bacilli bacterium]|nr:ribosome maturation factor RimM [Bacilli bacterium]